MNFIKKIPVLGLIFQKSIKVHNEAIHSFLISWIIVNLPIILNFLKDLNQETYKLPFKITDVIVYSISFIAPFVFCYKSQETRQKVFQDPKDACWGLCFLIILVSLLSFYYTLDENKLTKTSCIIIAILYVFSTILWYFSILTSIDEEKFDEKVGEVTSTIKQDEKTFVEAFNGEVEKDDK